MARKRFERIVEKGELVKAKKLYIVVCAEPSKYVIFIFKREQLSCTKVSD